MKTIFSLSLFLKYAAGHLFSLSRICPAAASHHWESFDLDLGVVCGTVNVLYAGKYFAKAIYTAIILTCFIT
ncbi:MAG: hypothetical protein KAS23_11795 [Anaerohalosphaera sp.]|nr:hypothetical protein [Anaerohalosphaera sp.]